MSSPAGTKMGDHLQV